MTARKKDTVARVRVKGMGAEAIANSLLAIDSVGP